MSYIEYDTTNTYCQDLDNTLNMLYQTGLTYLAHELERAMFCDSDWYYVNVISLDKYKNAISQVI